MLLPFQCAVLATAAIAAVAAAAPSARLTDALEWLYPDSAPESVTEAMETDVPANGVAEVNVLVTGLAPGEPLRFSCDVSGAEWFRLRAVPVSRNTGETGMLEKPGETNPFVTRDAPFDVFDAMEPIQDNSTDTGAGSVALRLRLRRFPVVSGPFTVTIRLSQGDAFAADLAFRVNVLPVAVPPVGPDSFKYSNWMDYRKAFSLHGVGDWTDAHFDMVARYVRLGIYARQNVAFLPGILTPGEDGLPVPDEARYARLIALLRSEGIAFLEGPHLARFTGGNWSASTFTPITGGPPAGTPEGDAELERLAAAFGAMVASNGWSDIWYQHVADEPSINNATAYCAAVRIVRRAMPGVRLLDAIDTTDVADAIDAPCPKTDGYEKNRAAYASAKAAQPGRETWCYTCCYPGGRWLNRFLDSPLLNPLLLSWACFLNGIDGYLHWGFNWFDQKWSPFDAIDPWKLPPGDRALVYPSSDGPWPSARLEAIRQGLEDLELLRLLARRDPARADAIARRIVRGFCDYDADIPAYRAARRELLEELSGITSSPLPQSQGAQGSQHL
ncbi:MAG: DUF4091 domain-containing protein [Kiritimatiellae bacterium]|nr:DUF4091 domain-containing protein [Kiritimatiellia bacterium]